MTEITPDDDLYFKGMYDKQLKEESKEDKTLVCAQCGSKNIVNVTVQQPVFIDVDISHKCENCGYQGKPKIIGSGES
jgi:transcription elongation factor Elf1